MKCKCSLSFLDDKTKFFKNCIRRSLGHNIIMYDLLDFFEKLHKETKGIKHGSYIVKH